VKVNFPKSWTLNRFDVITKLQKPKNKTLILTKIRLDNKFFTYLYFFSCR
jgi:hypothetical protein